ncbi:MAG: dienelactone hydrolase [Verrucomicrobiales bacterium]|jgi:dienelactone hydrolase
MKTLISLASSCWLFFAASTLIAGPIRALPEGQLPDDSRYADPTTLHDYHPFRAVASKAEWEIRQAHIKLRVQVGAGLWPMPEKTPVNAIVHGKVDRDDFTVERVYLESFPGHFVTGSIFRPAGDSLKLGEKNGKRPGILCPHGHWKNGRFYDAGEQAAKGQIAQGAERFMSAAHSPLQARCVQLARMGCVVLHYDMLGNADSIQFQEHRRGPRENLVNDKHGEWGFVSPQAAARLQTNFGLQTWNSVRALDFLTSLEDVDGDRLMVTGASGGGTQTQMLSAIDDRIDASFPCVMPSTAMQGGCTCENTHFLRIGQGNIDIAAAVAPRPQEMTAADDWTIELKEKGAPDLLALYKMVGAEGKFKAHFDVHFKHNYNHVSRTHMYGFVNRHFGIGLPSPVLERDFERLTQDELTVWSGEHPAPKGNAIADEHEKSLLRIWTDDADAQIGKLVAPESPEALTMAKKVLGQAYEVLIGRGPSNAADVEFELVDKESQTGFTALSGIVRNTQFNEEVPSNFLFPENWNGRAAIWVFPNGKAGLYENGALRPEAQQLLDAGTAVMSPDLWRQGEFLNEGEEAGENDRVQYPGDTDKPGSTWRLSSVYYYGYNDSTFARRVHDILNCIAFVRNNPKWDVKHVSLIGLDGAGHWAAAARAVAGGEVDAAAISTDGFRFANLESDWDVDFVPGAVKYGDVAGFLTVAAPGRIWLADGDAELRAGVKAAYEAASSADSASLKNAVSADFVEFLAE